MTCDSKKKEICGDQFQPLFLWSSSADHLHLIAETTSVAGTTREIQALQIDFRSYIHHLMMLLNYQLLSPCMSEVSLLSLDYQDENYLDLSVKCVRSQRFTPAWLSIIGKSDALQGWDHLCS